MEELNLHAFLMMHGALHGCQPAWRKYFPPDISLKLTGNALTSLELVHIITINQINKCKEWDK